jgi:RHS repeat-associated protein
MPGRKLSGGYRYGFNGKENDNEVKGEGNQQDYGMRIYDGRIGKFLSVDPLASEFPSWSPYSYGFNNPIFWTDPTGAAPEPPSTIVDERGNVVGGSNTDGDLGVYRVSGVTRGNFDASKIEQYKNQGTKIGETYSLYSFQSPSTGKWLGHVNIDNGAELSISKATQTLGKFMSTHSWKESLDEYMNHAGNFKGAYDLKTFGLAGGRNNPKEVIDAYAYEASFFGNKIMPRRDQGNFFAGRAANMLGLSEATMLSGFGAYQQNGNKINGFWNKTKIGLMSAVNWLDQQIMGAATNGTPAQGVNITPVFKDDKVSEDLQRAGYNQMKR